MIYFILLYAVYILIYFINPANASSPSNAANAKDQKAKAITREPTPTTREPTPTTREPTPTTRESTAQNTIVQQPCINNHDDSRWTCGTATHIDKDDCTAMTATVALAAGSAALFVSGMDTYSPHSGLSLASGILTGAFCSTGCTACSLFCSKKNVNNSPKDALGFCAAGFVPTLIPPIAVSLCCPVTVPSFIPPVVASGLSLTSQCLLYNLAHGIHEKILKPCLTSCLSSCSREKVQKCTDTETKEVNCPKEEQNQP